MSETNPPETTPKASKAKRKQNPLLIALILLIAAGAIALLVWELWPEPHNPRPTRAYYTADDGKTLFADDAERLPPFDHDGKPAVRAMVYSCDGGKTRFVGYLQKLPEDALQEANQKAVAAGRDPKDIDDDEIALKSGWLAKKPPERDWVNSKDHDRYAQTIKVACPDGRDGSPEQVFPPEPK